MTKTAVVLLSRKRLPQTFSFLLQCSKTFKSLKTLKSTQEEKFSYWLNEFKWFKILALSGDLSCIELRFRYHCHHFYAYLLGNWLWKLDFALCSHSVLALLSLWSNSSCLSVIIGLCLRSMLSGKNRLVLTFLSTFRSFKRNRFPKFHNVFHHSVKKSMPNPSKLWLLSL